jgi:hypothetical protein
MTALPSCQPLSVQFYDGDENIHRESRASTIENFIRHPSNSPVLRHIRVNVLVLMPSPRDVMETDGPQILDDYVIGTTTVASSAHVG